MKQLKIGFFSSHGGSNMQSILDAINDNKLNAEPCVLISNNSKSKAIERAKTYGFPYFHISQVTHPDPDEHDRVIYETLRRFEVEYVLLLGYMKKLGARTLSGYQGKILNIHPSLLPKHGGTGMFGRYVHEAVLENNETETGISIHLVDEEYDTGKVINQCRVPVRKGDTVENLSERVLIKEHEFLVETLIKIAKEEVVI